MEAMQLAYDAYGNDPTFEFRPLVRVRMEKAHPSHEVYVYVSILRQYVEVRSVAMLSI